MVDTTMKEELHQYLERLSPERQRDVLDFARSLADRPAGYSKAELLGFAGTISPGDAAEMKSAIEGGGDSRTDHPSPEFRDAPDRTRPPGSMPWGVPGRELLKFVGMIDPEDLAVMAKAIEEDCERIDHDGW